MCLCGVWCVMCGVWCVVCGGVPWMDAMLRSVREERQLYSHNQCIQYMCTHSCGYNKDMKRAGILAWASALHGQSKLLSQVFQVGFWCCKKQIWFLLLILSGGYLLVAVKVASSIFVNQINETKLESSKTLPELVSLCFKITKYHRDVILQLDEVSRLCDTLKWKSLLLGLKMMKFSENCQKNYIS